jgi:alanyl-tRNA synthetase
VTDEFLRFDFNHFSPLSPDEIRRIERMILEQVLRAVPVKTTVTGYSEARALGVKALFEEKYGDVVRVLEVPGFSSELCGGIHARNTGEIGLVKITKDEGIGSGVRRINAVCALPALELFQDSSATLRGVAEIFSTDPESLLSRAREMLDEKKTLERKNQELTLRGASENISSLLAGAARVEGAALVTGRFDGVPREMLRRIGDRIKQSEPNAVVLFAGVEAGQISLIGMATDAAVRLGVHAGNLVREVSAIMGGSGGGKPAAGQGGSRDAAKLDEALESAAGIVRAQIKK